MTPNPIHQFKAEDLSVKVYRTNEELGQAAAAEVAPLIIDAIAKKGEARVILATGNSQLSFTEALVQDKRIDWNKVVCFHMDEYVGIPDNHSASFRKWMIDRVVNVVHPQTFHLVGGDAPNTEAEIERYSRL